MIGRHDMQVFGRMLAAIWLALIPSLAAAQSDPRPLTPQQKREIVASAATAYRDYYVFAERGAEIAKRLRRDSAQGAYDRVEQPAAFAAALTSAIRAVQPDRHIEILAPELSAATVANAAPTGRAARLDWINRLRRTQLRFCARRAFAGQCRLSAPRIPSRRRRLPPRQRPRRWPSSPNSDALIVDLRENGGGTGDMVASSPAISSRNRLVLAEASTATRKSADRK